MANDEVSQTRSRLDRGAGLCQSRNTNRMKRLGNLLGHGFLLAVASSSTLAVLFIFYFIARDAIPFFQAEGFKEFFTSSAWYPSHSSNPQYGSLAIIYGSAMVAVLATIFAVPLGVSAAVCLSDVLPFSVRQYVKPMVEILATIPSVAYGFFALVVFAPMLQDNGGAMLKWALWIVGFPVATLGAIVVGDLVGGRFGGRWRIAVRIGGSAALGGLALWWLLAAGEFLGARKISSGVNALNVSIILGIMALPTIVSLSEDALTAAGRELREGSLALGATRAETIVKVVIPAARSGILAAIILGVMRAVGETMVVWMASGNSSQIPKPWYNVLQPVRTLTATIAGDMGEADQVTGSSRYHVLFAMALCLLVFSLGCNLVSEWIVRRSRRRLSGG
ncbi:MAG: ABC transporter permease subunit [Anaerolineaceae bacterium]|nr:ABC transporter permease subunit [Anaerolineaceae bacterium]